MITQDIDIRNRYIKAKRAIFDKIYANLNDRQREAVFTINSPLLILAGAGSGKTTVLVNRIAFIIKYGNAYMDEHVPEDVSLDEVEKLEHAITLSKDDLENIAFDFTSNPCPPWAVLSITFTNKAANEMKERLSRVIGEEADNIWASTFHSICMRLLRKYTTEAGLSSGFTIYDTDDVKKLITNCLKDLNIDEKVLPPRAVMNQISRAKDRLQTPADFAADASDLKLKQIAKVYELYQHRLTESNAVDFDDIIMRTVQMLETHPEVRDYCQTRFRYICVDEYQDTNKAQFKLTLLLSGKYRNLMVVGDDDQSIYKFRGATIENILGFDKELPDAKVIKLEQNYRSTKCILGAANSIIRNNFGRRGKELWCDNAEGDRIIVKKLGNQNEEARYIINKIMDSVIREKRKLSDFAVLYRVNAQSNSLEQVFAKSGVAYRMLGGLRFFERKEIKDIIAYLCVVCNTGDNLRLRRIINEPKRKIGEATVNAIAQIAEAEGCSMFNIMENAEKYLAISKSATKLKDFTYLIRELQRISASGKISKLIESTIELTGYRKMLLLMGDSEIERLENVQELISNAVEYENSHEEPSLANFLEEVALVNDIDNYDENADAVVLMTIHSAKGLEFPVVFLPGFENGIFPGIQAQMQPDELEEERRLAYVAVTRAKERLFITHVRERLIYGRTSYNPPSKFLEEIPEEYLERDLPPKNAEDKKPHERPKRTIISKEFLKQSDLTANVGRTKGFERFSAGDTVEHMSFGRGEILSVKEMGSDLLYEIAFETVGTKKLMATYAKLKKI